LPPDEEDAAVFLNLLATRAGIEFQAEAVVKIFRVVVPPAVPSERIIWEWIGESHR
jgi:hypothetical protein